MNLNLLLDFRADFVIQTENPIGVRMAGRKLVESVFKALDHLLGFHVNVGNGAFNLGLDFSH